METYRSRKTVKAELISLSAVNRAEVNMLHCSKLTREDEAYMVYFPNGFKCVIGKEEFERCWELCK